MLSVKSAVAVRSCKDYDSGRVKSVVKRLLDDINFSLPKNATVLIKPNLLLPASPERAITTHPSIIRALCELLCSRGNKVIIGETLNSLGKEELKRRFDVCGISKAAKGCAELISLESSGITNVSVGGELLSSVPLPKALSEVNLIINVPKLKTHALTKYTGAIKNFYGFIPGATKAAYHLKARSSEAFSELLLDIYAAVLKLKKPILTVMDGVVGIEGLGPGTGGTKKKTGLMLASMDCLALDIVAARIIGFRSGEVLTNAFAQKKAGITVKNKIKISFNGKPIKAENLPKVEYKKPVMTFSVPSIIARILKPFTLPNPVCDVGVCTKCGRCAEVCPAKAIQLKPYPVVNRRACIHCFCCYEHCRYNAIYLKRSRLLTLMSYAKKLFDKSLSILGGGRR